MDDVDPYATEAHIRWIDAGRCSSINRHKAWCNGAREHILQHFAPYEDESGHTRYVYWGDAEAFEHAV